MNCVICKTGQTYPGQTNVTLHHGKSLIVIKHVRAKICDNCGEYYLDEPTTREINEKAKKAIEGSEVEVFNLETI